MQKTEVIKLKDLPLYEKNPFIVELKGKMYLHPRANTIVAQGEAIIDKATGEVVQDKGVLLGRRRLVDKSQFAKIYASEIGVLFELSKPAINVFLYLSKVMDYENRSFFNYYSSYQKAGYKNFDTPLKGLKELLRKDIIAMSERPHQYWLNPTIVCKGERYAVYTEYVLNKETEKEGENQLADQSWCNNETLNEDLGKKKELADRQTTLPI